MAEVTFTHDALPPPPDKVSWYDDIVTVARSELQVDEKTDPFFEGWDRTFKHEPGTARPEFFHHPLGQDTHRWVTSLLRGLGDDPSSDQFLAEVAFPLYLYHGGLYATNEPFQRAEPMAAWHRDLQGLAEAIEADPEGQQALLKERFHRDQHGPIPTPPDATMTLEGGVRFHAKNLLGWMWVLVARDAIEEVTYEPCEGCGERSRGFYPRQIATPSPTLPDRQWRQIKFCGRQCKTRHHTRLKRAKRTREKREKGANQAN